MKLTKSYLKKLILEGLSEAGEPGEAGEAGIAAPDLKTDVQKVLMYIEKIDQKVEYEQLLNMILKHAANVPMASGVLKKILKELPKFIQTIR